jgi:hypothetical protein
MPARSTAAPTPAPAVVAKAVIERARQTAVPAKPAPKAAQATPAKLATPTAPAAPTAPTAPTVSAAPVMAATTAAALAPLPVVTQVVSPAPADDGDWETF